MESLKIAGSPKQPTIELSPNGILRIEGRSIPENAVEFYTPIMDWIKGYAATKPAKTIMEVKYEYFNTATSKCVLEIFKRLGKLVQEGCDVKVVWFYQIDDEDMLEAGEDFREVAKIPFEIKSYK